MMADYKLLELLMKSEEKNKKYHQYMRQMIEDDIELKFSTRLKLIAADKSITNKAFAIEILVESLQIEQSLREEIYDRSREYRL